MKTPRLLSHTLVLVSLLWLTSCKSTKPTVITNTKTETIKETVHDTVFEIAADSSAIKALLDCQNGKVVIKDIIESNPGKNLNIPKITIKDNQLNVDCSAEAQRLFAQWKSLEVYKTLTEQQPVYIEHELTFWERLFIGLGKIALALGVITVTIWITKKQITAYGLKK